MWLILLEVVGLERDANAGAVDCDVQLAEPVLGGADGRLDVILRYHLPGDMESKDQIALPSAVVFGRKGTRMGQVLFQEEHP